MRPFEYRRATELSDAVAALSQRPSAAVLAGGTNLVDHMKLGVAAPDTLIDITALPLNRVEELPDGGLRVGATVRNSDLAAHRLVRERFPALAMALLSGASPQLRHAATTAGNLLQRTRCDYFQDVTTPCNKREPGSGCTALSGYTRYHAVLGASEHCVATHPSDMAVAMCALDAVVVILGPGGQRRIPLADFHRLPGNEPDRDTVLEHGELITAVELPALPPDTHSTYRKVRDRASYAFALFSVAAVLRLDGGRVSDLRIALGGVAHKPWRAVRAERALRGKPVTEQHLARAADDELVSAEPLRDNGFKVPMARATVVHVLRQLAEEARA